MLKIENLTKEYNGKKIYDGFNFQVEKGEMIVLSGPSGCGKTTLLNIFGMLDSNYTGNLYINDIKNPKMHKASGRKLLQNKMGYIFQNFALIENLTVLENLNLALDHLKCNKSEKIKKMNLALRVVQLSGYLNKKVYTLSGGEQQRVAIARVIIKDVDIILADEPTGSLDTENRDLVLWILEKLNKQGKTIVIVSHDEYVIKKYKNISLKG